MEAELERTNEIQQQLVSARTEVEDKQCQAEEMRCQLELVKVEMEKLKEQLNVTHDELAMERRHTAELTEMLELQPRERKSDHCQTDEVLELQPREMKSDHCQTDEVLELQPREMKSDHCQTDEVLELQPREMKSDHCQTDEVSDPEMCVLLAEIDHLKALLNTKQNELDTEHCQTHELKEKLSELQVLETTAVQEQENSRVLTEIEQSDDMMNTTQNELDLNCCYTDMETQLTEIDNQTDTESELEETVAEVEQSRVLLHSAVMESKHCQTDGVTEDNNELELLREQLTKAQDELSSERSTCEMLRQQLQCHLSDIEAVQQTLHIKVLLSFLRQQKL